MMLSISFPLHRSIAFQNRVFVSLLTGVVALLATGMAHAHTGPDFGFGIQSCACYAPGTPTSGDFVVGPSNPGKWGVPGFGNPGGTVTYSFATGAGYAITEASPAFTGTVVPLETFMPAGFKAQIVNAFNAWSAVANIQFVEVVDNGVAFDAAGATGDIRIGGHNLGGPGGTLAHGYYPPANGVSAAGDIHFDTQDTWKIGFGGGGFDIFQVAAHEIGHAIGLNHTAVPNSLMNPNYTETFSGLQADDIAGGQFIYGAAVVVVPEASTFTLLPIGALVAIGLLRRRKAA